MSDARCAPVDAVVEMRRGAEQVRYDFSTGAIGSIGFSSSVHYPTDYGFIPWTRAADGDTLDVLIIVEEPTFPGCRVKVRPIGVLQMRDEHGVDEKILAVPVADPRFRRDQRYLGPSKALALRDRELLQHLQAARARQGGPRRGVAGPAPPWRCSEVRGRAAPAVTHPAGKARSAQCHGSSSGTAPRRACSGSSIRHHDDRPGAGLRHHPGESSASPAATPPSISARAGRP